MNQLTTIVFVVLAGLLAGAIHVLSGPDHLAAVAPFTASHPKKSWKIGLFWGIGHTGSVWMIAVIIFLLKGFIPLAGLSQWGEKLVGFVLVGLGIYGIRKAFSTKLHYHAHPHSGLAHAHYHTHDVTISHEHAEQQPHQHTHAPLGIGLLHGLAGSAHLLAIIPALALPGQYNAFGYVAGFGVGTIIAMMCFSWLIGLLQHKVIHRFSNGYKWMQLSFAFLAISVGIFWLANN